MPGIVTIVPAWKLDPVYCTGLKVGLPQVSLGALLALHELLMALESRLSSADSTAVTEEADHGIADTARTKDGAHSKPARPSRDSTAPARPRSRRREAVGHDTGRAVHGSEDAGSFAARGCRHGSGGGRR